MKNDLIYLINLKTNSKLKGAKMKIHKQISKNKMTDENQVHELRGIITHRRYIRLKMRNTDENSYHTIQIPGLFDPKEIKYLSENFNFKLPKEKIDENILKLLKDESTSPVVQAFIYNLKNIRSDFLEIDVDPFGGQTILSVYKYRENHEGIWEKIRKLKKVTKPNGDVEEILTSSIYRTKNIFDRVEDCIGVANCIRGNHDKHALPNISFEKLFKIISVVSYPKSHTCSQKIANEHDLIMKLKYMQKCKERIKGDLYSKRIGTDLAINNLIDNFPDFAGFAGFKKYESTDGSIVWGYQTTQQ